MSIGDALVGRFVVFHGSAFVSRLIQYGTSSRDNHTGILLGDGTLVEALGAGVARNPLKDYSSKEMSVSHMELNPVVASGIASFALAQVGKPYNYPGIAAIALDQLGIKPQWMDDWAAHDGRWFCSQLVAAAYASQGIQLVEGKEPWQVSPGDLGYLIEHS